MKLSSSIALAAIIVAGVATPVFAASSTSDDSKFDRDYILTQLHQKGVAAVDADENWNGVIRVTVKLADGNQQFQYFTEDTLQPVKSVTGSNTRVLSKLDTGVKTGPVTSLRSLADSDDGFFD